MKSRVQRWGNSLAIRIPKPIAEQIQISENSDVELEVKDGALVLRRPRRTPFSLDDLIAGINTENCHGEADWGDPVGKETAP